MKYFALALTTLTLAVGSASAGDCLRAITLPTQQFSTGGCSAGSAFSYGQTQTLEIRPAYQPQPQAVILREVAPAPVYHGQALILRQSAPAYGFQVQQFHAQQFRAQPQRFQRVERIEVRREVAGGGGSGVLGVVGAALRTVGNVAGAVIGRP